MWRSPLAALGAAATVGVALLLLVVGLGRDGGSKRPRPPARPPFDVLYRPPAFVQRGRPTKLRYELVCPLTGPPKPGFCRPGGVLHVRRVGGTEFDEIPLATVREGLATVSVPARYSTGSGFEYYVELHDERGRSATVPGGGAAAPQRSWAIDHWTIVELGRHRFGATRRGTAILEAGWGKGTRRLGLQRGVGPSSFAVTPDGAILVLDQLNRRLAVYPERAGRPRYVPIRFLGGEGDVAIARDGTAYVLDAGSPKEHVPFVRSYSADLRALAATPVAETPSNRIAIGPAGAIVHAVPSEQWLPVGERERLLAPDEQERRARPARPFQDGRELVVAASASEARVALFGPGGVVGSWRIRSATPLGEVQLAEPYRQGLLVALRVHTERRAEWQVLELTEAGVVDRFSVRPVEWADAASGGRFRIAGRYLYELRSGRAGVEVARYRLAARGS
jgi:hypothetical protein